jgi:hypothetical protein
MFGSKLVALTTKQRRVSSLVLLSNTSAADSELPLFSSILRHPGIFALMVRHPCPAILSELRPVRVSVRTENLYHVTHCTGPCAMESDSERWLNARHAWELPTRNLPLTCSNIDAAAILDLIRTREKWLKTGESRSNQIYRIST